MWVDIHSSIYVVTEKMRSVVDYYSKRWSPGKFEVIDDTTTSSSRGTGATTAERKYLRKESGTENSQDKEEKRSHI